MSPDNGHLQSGRAVSVSVCVPATRWDTVGATIQAVRAQTRTEWEMIVLGQGAREPLEAAVDRAAAGDGRIRFIHLQSRGLSRARNAALGHAAGAVVAFTDDDCEPDPRWLATIVQAFQEDSELGVVGGAVLAPASKGRFATCPTISPGEALYDPATSWRRPPPGWDWMGANFAIRRDVAARLGKFDECLGAGADFPAGEDTDYKLRLEAARVRMMTTPRAAVVHTYGVRRGWAMLRSQSNYATGNGGTAGKLTLLGDPLGAEWLDETSRMFERDRRRAPHQAVRAFRRLHLFAGAYRRCLDEYRVEGGLLARI